MTATNTTHSTRALKFSSLAAPLFLIFTLFFTSSVFAQNSNEWQIVKSQNGIEYYSKITGCEIRPNTVYDYVVFKIVNTNTYAVDLNLGFEIHFEEGCNGCDDDLESSISLHLNPGESIESSCSSLDNKLAYFILNPNFNESWHYTHSVIIIH